MSRLDFDRLYSLSSLSHFMAHEAWFLLIKAFCTALEGIAKKNQGRGTGLSPWDQERSGTGW